MSEKNERDKVGALANRAADEAAKAAFTAMTLRNTIRDLDGSAGRVVEAARRIVAWDWLDMLDDDERGDDVREQVEELDAVIRSYDDARRGT